MKKVLSLLLTLVLVFALAACGSDDATTDTTDNNTGDTTTDGSSDTDADTETPDEDTEDEGDTSDAATDFSVALVTDTGGIDDKSFNQGTWEGITRFSEDTGAEINYAQSSSDADYIPNLSTFSDDEYSLIVAPGFLFVEAIGEVSQNYPEQHYLIIDEVVADRDNVASATFASEQGSFLVGVAAAQATLDAGKTKVGFVGGGDFPLIQSFEAGYEAGVKSVDESLEVVINYVGDFVDTAKGQQLASQMYNDGVYVIYHAAGGAGNGVIKEAKDRRTTGEDVWVIGVDKDQYEDGLYDGENSAILTSMMKRVDVAAYQVAEMAMNGNFPGGEELKFSLEDGGVGLPEENPNLSEEIVALVDDYEAQILSGDIEVPSVPVRLQ